MYKKYILKVVENDNELIDAQRGQFVALLKKEEIISYTNFQHVNDIFKATFFDTKDLAKKAVKKHGPWGVEYYIAIAVLKIS